VQYNGYKSLPFKASSGVPPGSNLGPLLFLIFINDIVESIEVEHQIYADDLRLYVTVEDPGDCLKLQRSLNGVSEWRIANRLPLNAAKCSVMTITRKHSSFSYSYTMDQVPLARVTNVRDLGVLVDSKLT